MAMYSLTFVGALWVILGIAVGWGIATAKNYRVSEVIPSWSGYQARHSTDVVETDGSKCPPVTDDPVTSGVGGYGGVVVGGVAMGVYRAADIVVPADQRAIAAAYDGHGGSTVIRTAIRRHSRSGGVHQYDVHTRLMEFV